ncbi:MAG: hypothetical protein ACP6IT_07470, partial [Candidatus Thorarchaeota archaeon]
QLVLRLLGEHPADIGRPLVEQTHAVAHVLVVLRGGLIHPVGIGLIQPALLAQVAEELAHSYASESPLISLAIMTAENELVTYVRQLRRGVGATEAYGFFIPGPSGSFEVFRIEGKRATLGDDFRVLLLSGRDAEVAEIDSKFADVGGEFQVRIKDKILADNELFCRVLQCFSVVTRYRKEMRAKTLGLLERWRKGEIVPKQHRYEASLMGNPRRLTLDTKELEEV